MLKPTAVVALLGIALATPGRGSDEVPGSDTNPFLSAAGITSTCGSCYDCVDGNFVGHFFSTQGFAFRWGSDHDCYILDCTSDYHPGCFGFALHDAEDEASLDEGRLWSFIAAAVNGDISSLKDALLEYPNRVHVNRERRAIQVTAACSPTLVVAHLVVNDTELQEIGSSMP